MINKIKDLAYNLAYIYKIAPLGNTFTVLAAATAVADYDNPLSIPFYALTSLGGFFLSGRQFSLGSRLEDSIAKHGYDERVFRTTLGEWCDRQTALAVASRHNCSDAYLSLRQQNSGIMRLGSIPNF